jgi:iron complex transport system substrate-binding protein
MKKKLSLFVLISLLSIMTVACSSNDKDSAGGNINTEPKEEITVTHELGETTVTKNPKTVVVFDMGTLDTLDQLGVEVAAVPHDGLPSYLSKYESTTENAGGLKEPDFEAISALAPDLILISTRQAEAYEELSKIAPTVYVGIDTAKYVESVEKNITLIGEIFGKEKEVADKLAAVEEKINSLKATVPTDKTGLVILASGGKISAFGPESRFGLIHDVFGIPAVDDKLEVSQHGQSISPEYIAEKNPDYLFVIDRDAVVDGGGTTAKATVENDIVKSTNAFKEGKVIYLDPNYWYLSGGGLESLEKMINDVEEAVK